MVVVVGVMDNVFTYHLYHIGGTCVCMYCFWCVIPNGDLSLFHLGAQSITCIPYRECGLCMVVLYM